MVEQVGPAGQRPPDIVSMGGKDKMRPASDADASPAEREKGEVTVSISLQALIKHVREAETHRKERVHQVLEKVRDGTLISSEALREAAERIIKDGP